MENGGTAASRSEGAVGDQEAGATQSKGGAAAASRPPYICRVGVDGFACVCECQVDEEPYQVHCSAGITVPEGEESKPYIVGTVVDSGAGISCVSEATVCTM